MATITIIGSGQAGCQLALGLQAQGYNVTLVSDRSPDDIAAGSVLSTQCMFGAALAHERALGLNFWDASCPPIEGLMIRVAGADEPALAWGARLDRPAQSVDQRIKLPMWMRLFEQRGGRLITQAADVRALEGYAQESDLVIVAAGKGEIARLFERDATRSPYAAPQRALALACVHGLEAETPFEGVCFNLIPGVGEFFVMPGLTHSGPCHYLLAEAIPGGPLDIWEGVKSDTEHLGLLQDALRRFLPWEAARARAISLADGRSTLRGRYAPTVRKPVAVLPSGAAVLGMADAVVLNDPITGQGANNAARCAALYLASILAHGDQPFDTRWMQRTFDSYWEHAAVVTGWTNAMLQPPPAHMMQLMGAAAELPGVARWFVNGFDEPTTLFPALADPEAAAALIQREALVTA
jgi:2-polyprenyl-6-methoxyphenol hydroxylase-like FAD-dependent oxidoreductase